MDWQQLFQMQKKLDHYIVAQHHLENEYVFDKKVLALLVEVGELANETRCFKYWSVKPPSEKQVIAEEYVDGIHFILSLGLELGVEDFHHTTESIGDADVTDQFHQAFSEITALKQQPTINQYQQVFTTYLKLGESLGFTPTDIQKAYADKNKINFERQDTGY
ncbi:dUTPase [Gracilibacillus halophilus YIM-C55.5]|uniref:dUTPase n=1 Tax=Gracilibacillus halophilus YIM-C55.5 TaxID=1308866 RepID=N4W9U9_9BACI|nr:dUTP diphosphatase [Gracilibacillus halophilus]ENH97048.1 dUTPase [Gracilibacillus halophilus YIM-C55.5]